MAEAALSRVDHTPAQAGAGDTRVVAGPGYREIPRCKLPLTTEAAQNEYDLVARTLFDAGKLDLFHHSQLSIYASMFDKIASGANASGRDRDLLQRALEALKLDELNSGPIAASKGAPVNKFAGAGFSARRR
jgi:hypothetical protein